MAGYNLFPVLIAFILFQFLRFSQSQVSTVPPPFKPELIDTLEDLKTLQWITTPPLKSVATSAELPAEFVGLDGEGIMYFDEGSVNQAIVRNPIEPYDYGYLYLKYSTYFKGGTSDPQSSAYVSPVLDVNIKILPPTNGVEWREELINLNMMQAVDGGFEFGASRYRAGDFLLFEKVALVQSKQVMTIEEIKQLFPTRTASPEPTVTSTTPTSQESFGTSVGTSVAPISQGSTVTTTIPTSDKPTSTSTTMTSKKSTVAILTTEFGQNTESTTAKSDTKFKTWEIFVYFVIPAIILLVILLLICRRCRKRTEDSDSFSNFISP